MIARNRATDFHRADRRISSSCRSSCRSARRSDRSGGHAALDAIRSLPDAYRETLVLRSGRRADRSGDCDPNRADAGLGAREPASRDEAAAREAGTMSDDLKRDDDYLWDGAGTAGRGSRCASRSLLARYRHQRHDAGAARDRVVRRRMRRRSALTARHRRRVAGARRRRGVVRPHRSAAVGMDCAVARGLAARGGRADRISRSRLAVGRDADHRRAIARAAGGRRHRPRGRRAQQPRCGCSSRGPASIGWRSIAAASAR